MTPEPIVAVIEEDFAGGLWVCIDDSGHRATAERAASPRAGQRVRITIEAIEEGL